MTAAIIAAGAVVLATRLILLLVLIGAFALAYLAVERESLVDLGVLIAYAICVLLPVIGLEMKTVFRGGLR